MKKKTLIPSLLLTAASLFMATSCDKEKNKNKNENTTGKELTVTIDSRDYTKWQYFSFEQGRVIGESTIDSAHLNDPSWAIRTDWDIAFHRSEVRTNSGASGNGNGGAWDASETDFSKVTTAPSTGYIVDTVYKIMCKPSMDVSSQCLSGASFISKVWISMSGMPPTYTVSNKIFVIKTAQGKYAKIHLKDYYNEDASSGYVTMQYYYQPDGTTDLNIR